MERHLLFDDSCTLCTGLAQNIERETNGWLTARSLRDPAMRELLDKARPGWKWESTLVEVNGERVRVYTGVKLRSRLVVGLGPKRAVRVAQLVQQALAPKPEVDQGRRTFLQRGAMLAGLLVVPSAVYAKEPKPSTPPVPDPATLEKEQKKRLAAIHKIEKHLRVAADGTIEIKEKKADKVGVDQQLFDELMAGLNNTNELIRKGELKTSEVQLQTPAEPEAGGQVVGARAGAAATTPDAVTAAACRGWSGQQRYWWGVRLFYNSCDIARLLGAADVGAGLATICAIGMGAVGGVVAGLPCGIFAGVIVVYSGTIQYASTRGNGGVYIDFNIFMGMDVDQAFRGVGPQR